MKNKYILGLCGAAALALTTSAYATTDAIRYSLNGTSWTTVGTDGNGDGVIPDSGNLTITGNGYNLSFVSSFTFDHIGSAAAPQMDLNIQGTTGVGDIWVEFSVTTFTPLPHGTIDTTVISTMGAGSQTEITRIGDDNTLFSPDADHSNTAPTIGPLTGIGQIGTSKLSAVGAPDPYSITMQVHFHSDSSGQLISMDDFLRVPDGGNTLMLLGSALSVLGFGAFRKSRKA